MHESLSQNFLEIIVVQGCISDFFISDVMDDNFLLFTDTYQKQIYQMDITSGAFHAVPLSGHDNPIAVDYDHIEHRVGMNPI